MGLDDRFTGRSGAGEDRGFGGAEHRGYSSGYDQGGGGPPTGFGAQPGDDAPPGPEEGDSAKPGADEGYGAQGPGQGHTGGGAPARSPDPVGGYRSGQWGVGHQGANAEIGGHHAGPHRGRGPVGYVRTDARIRENVCEALTDDDDIDARAIDVIVEHGAVTLRGTVPDQDTRHHAEELARRCAGVQQVLDQLVVDTKTHRA